MSIEFIPVGHRVWVPHIEGQYFLPYIRQVPGSWGYSYDIFVFDAIANQYVHVDTVSHLEDAQNYIIQKLVERKLK